MILIVLMSFCFLAVLIHFFVIIGVLRDLLSVLDDVDAICVVSIHLLFLSGYDALLSVDVGVHGFLSVCVILKWYVLFLRIFLFL